MISLYFKSALLIWMPFFLAKWRNPQLTVKKPKIRHFTSTDSKFLKWQIVEAKISVFSTVIKQYAKKKLKTKLYTEKEQKIEFQTFQFWNIGK